MRVCLQTHKIIECKTVFPRTNCFHCFARNKLKLAAVDARVLWRECTYKTQKQKKTDDDTVANQKQTESVLPVLHAILVAAVVAAATAAPTVKKKKDFKIKFN